MKLDNSLIEKGRLEPVWSKIRAASKIIGIYIILVIFVLICGIVSPVFFNLENIINIIRQISVVTIIALGETVLLISGMIDLSAGSVLALAGCVAVVIFLMTGSIILALLAAVGVGALTGAISGAVVTGYNAPPFIVTLAMMTIARGAVLILTRGSPIYNIGSFTVLGQGHVLGIPVPVLFLIGLLLLTWVLLNGTKFGRYLYAIGGNAEAAIASGVRVKSVKFRAFVLGGAFAGIAGALLMSRIASGMPNVGVNYEFDAITAAIIGGTGLSGGTGTVSGTIAGACIMGVLNNILNLLNVQAYYQQILKGIIIVVAVVIDIKAKSSTKKKRILL